MDSVYGLILAGGKATRMGETNKGAKLLGSRPLVEHVIERLRPQVKNLFISANSYKDYYEKFGYEVIADKRENFLGPLSGIESILVSHPGITWLFVSPVDTPFIPLNIVSTLLDRAVSQNAACAIPVHDGFKEPLHCLINASLLPSLKHCLDNQQYSVGKFLSDNSVIQVPFFDVGNSFENVNTLKELEFLNQTN